jgi:bifunctional DNA-binding transcriptional regulator/antitoxin component of YhaV-PrlF toxin-antitoxin module
MKRHEDPVVQDETKSTSRHQITIPKAMWEYLKIREGMRFIIKVYSNRIIELIERDAPLELSDEAWKQLVDLSKSEKQKGKIFSTTKEAKKYLHKL